MTASYKKIDYRLRPAKYVERLMIAELATRLRFHDVRSYRYVGLGSIFFTDFKLMHRALGIGSMISIEAEERDRERFDWNRPYDTIEMRYGTTDAVLPAMSWAEPSIVWLDYDDQISQSKLQDVDLLLRSAQPGSLLLFSINAEHPSPEGHRDGDDFVAALRSMVGPERVDPALRHEHLQGWSAAKVYRRIINAAAEASIATSNALIGDPQRHRRWQQLVNIEYQDGARMLTIGGIVYEAHQEHALVAGAFDKLGFHRDGEAAFRIGVPKLTLKEMGHLEKSAMKEPAEVQELAWLKPKDRSQFLELYRYLPNFVPAEI